jgi:hypothetical protein
MCLILHSKIGFDAITKRELTAALRANSDGVGVFFDSGTGAEVIREEEMSYRALRSLLREIGRADTFVHLRMATNNVGGLDGVHPFPVFGDSNAYEVWVAHNGVFRHAPRGVHDSQYFVAETLAPILRRDPFAWRLPAFRDLLTRAIGDGNRLAILDSAGHSAEIGRWYQVADGVSASNLYAWGSYFGGRFDGDDWEF